MYILSEVVINNTFTFEWTNTPFTWTKIIQIRDLDSDLDREILSV